MKRKLTDEERQVLLDNPELVMFTPICMASGKPGRRQQRRTRFLSRKCMAYVIVLSMIMEALI